MNTSTETNTESPAPAEPPARSNGRRRFWVLLLTAGVTFGLCITMIQNTRVQKKLLDSGRISQIPETRRVAELGPKLEDVTEVGYVGQWENRNAGAFRFYSAQLFLAPTLVHDSTDQPLVVLDFPTREQMHWWCLNTGFECVYDAGNGLGLAEQ